mgnify:CR=1 FL=1
MFYFISGTPRCGKTTLAKMARSHIDGQIIATDGFMKSLQENTEKEWYPNLFYHTQEIIYGNDAIDKKIEGARGRDAVVWKFLKPYLKEAIFTHDDVLIEGTIWPDMLQELDDEYRAVFLVDTDENHFERLMHIRENAEHSNWMKDFPEERMVEFAKFNIARSMEYIRQCDELGFPYYDIADFGIEKAQELAMKELIG